MLVSAPSKSQLIMLAKLCKDFVEVGFQGFGVTGHGRQTVILDLSPEDLDVVEFGAVG